MELKNRSYFFKPHLLLPRTHPPAAGIELLSITQNRTLPPLLLWACVPVPSPGALLPGLLCLVNSYSPSKTQLRRHHHLLWEGCSNMGRVAVLPPIFLSFLSIPPNNSNIAYSICLFTFLPLLQTANSLRARIPVPHCAFYTQYLYLYL